MHSVLERLKERKLVQWGVAYLAGAWLVLQVIDVFGDRWGISHDLARTIDVLLALGLVATLIVAWYHGDRGRQRVSGMEILILAALLAVGGGVVTLLDARGTELPTGPAASALPSTDHRLSIAVLPFANMSDDPANQYFSDGISEEILNALASIPGLRVPSRTSAFSFRDESVPIREIARQLGVDRVLEGSVRKTGNRVRITAQLIDARTDSHLWSQTYERELEDIFAIQREISASIVGALPGTLRGAEAGPGSGPPTSNVDAYERFLRGLYQFHNARDLDLAVERFEEAVELDPGFARAWATLSYAYTQVALFAPGPVPPSLLARSETAAERALDADPSLPMAHGALGWLRAVQMRWIDAEHSLLRAIEGGAGDALPYLRYGTLLTDVGRTRDANEVLLRAAQLDPLNGITEHWLADSYRNLGMWEESRLHAQRSLDLGLVASGIGVYLYHLQHGADEEAIAVLEEYEPMWGVDPSYATPLVEAVRDSSRISAAVEALRTAAPDDHRFELTQFLFDLAAPDLLFDELDRMVEEGRIVFALWRMWEPDKTHLRRHPRFSGLAARIGLLDYWRANGWPDLCEPEASGFRCR